jgi:uncharacterized protein with HEPN domain
LRGILLVSHTRNYINDEKTIDAVVRNLEIIGEAANQIPMEIRQRNKEVP